MSIASGKAEISKHMQRTEPLEMQNFQRNLRTSPVPSGYVKIAIENVPFIADLPIDNGDFP